jgi:hypothetical protein
MDERSQSLNRGFNNWETAEFFYFNQIFNRINQFNQEINLIKKISLIKENPCFQLFSIGSMVMSTNNDCFDCRDFLIFLIFLIALISV